MYFRYMHIHPEKHHRAPLLFLLLISGPFGPSFRPDRLKEKRNQQDEGPSRQRKQNGKRGAFVRECSACIEKYIVLYIKKKILLATADAWDLLFQVSKNLDYLKLKDPDQCPGQMDSIVSQDSERKACMDHPSPLFPLFPLPGSRARYPPARLIHP